MEPVWSTVLPSTVSAISMISMPFRVLVTSKCGYLSHLVLMHNMDASSVPNFIVEGVISHCT